MLKIINQTESVVRSAASFVDLTLELSRVKKYGEWNGRNEIIFQNLLSSLDVALNTLKPVQVFLQPKNVLPLLRVLQHW